MADAVENMFSEAFNILTTSPGVFLNCVQFDLGTGLVDF
jgi:hypothetical protein